MVASICYQSPKALGSISLFERLQAESGGLPSSSYEFIPVLLNRNTVVDILSNSTAHQPSDVPIIKFGTWLSDKVHLLTNLRALIEMVGPDDSLNYLNTSDEEIQIIRDNFKVFLFNVDLPTRAQMVRHRINWQELSRRYVSGKKSPFSFYTSNKMADVNVDFRGKSIYTAEYIELGIGLYNEALDRKIKPEEARRILPQAMMTQIWGAFQPSQLDNWFTLRLDKHAQLEIRCVAEAMKELIDGN
jgi:thymidylate synthase (FAD)